MSILSGIHQYTRTCADDSIDRKVEEILSTTNNFLFPKSLEVFQVGEKEFHPLYRKPNGGWGDKRDRKLCLLISKQEVTSEQDLKLIPEII